MVKNKMAVINVLSGIIQNPLLLMDENYKLTPDDFPERFHKIVFAAVDHLAHNGVKEINEAVIDDYLTNYPKQHKIFEDNRGMDYITKAVELSSPGNFDYYYNSLKKCSVLNALESKGFDISSFYNPDIMHVDEQQVLQERLDGCSVEDILSKYELDLIDVKQMFGTESTSLECQAGDGAEELIEQLKKTPEMGMGLNSKKLTTICRGRRLKKLYMRTAPTGVGKTRLSLADACYAAVPKLYDSTKQRWVKTGNASPTLYISTELEIDELQSMILAYVSNVPEDHILDGKYEPGEEARVKKAAQIIKEAPLYLVQIAQFNADDLEATIRKYKLKHNIAFVFFDYIHTSIKMLEEISRKSRGVSLREDNVLVMFADRMKSLANRLNIHIDSSTQANGDWKGAEDPDQSLIRGSKAIADKVDIGICVLSPSQKDLAAVQSILAQQGQAFMKQPNLVYHVYKVRRGKLNHVKVFVHFDYGTLRTTDLFVTDKDYKLLNVANTTVESILDETDITEQEGIRNKTELTMW